MKKTIFIICIALLSSFYGKSQTHPLDVGNQVPAFTLKDQDGKTFNMKDSVGNNIYVIFFYPKDESLVCTKEACAFRDSMNAIKQYGATVIGISKSSIENHKKFQHDDKLNYELLSDPDEKALKQFGIKGGLLSDRVTYVVDISGQIVFKTESNAEGKKHVAEVLNYLRHANKKMGN